MRDDERRALAQVRYEQRVLADLVRDHPDRDGSAAKNLKATYLIRLYAQFKGLLRDRLVLASNDEISLVNCIQRLSGDQVGYDPANDGRAVVWWQLFRRDRNLLAHGRGLRPSIGLDVTRGLMEQYLSRLKD